MTEGDEIPLKERFMFGMLLVWAVATMTMFGVIVLRAVGN